MRRRNPPLAEAYLRQRFNYIPEKAELRWRARVGDDRFTKTWNTRFANTIAGTIHSDGYRVIQIDGRDYLSHHIIWCLETHKWPDSDLDHRSLDQGNNHIDNLRPATSAQNQWNTVPRANNTSGCKGVSFDKRSGKWRAYIYVKGTQISLGFFSNKDAAAAYARAAGEHQGEFARVHDGGMALLRWMRASGTSLLQLTEAAAREREARDVTAAPVESGLTQRSS
jgi:hypothetical protein